jgi:hypothetical protein
MTWSQLFTHVFSLLVFSDFFFFFFPRITTTFSTNAFCPYSLAMLIHLIRIKWSSFVVWNILKLQKFEIITSHICTMVRHSDPSPVFLLLDRSTDRLSILIVRKKEWHVYTLYYTRLPKWKTTKKANEFLYGRLC